MEFDSKSLNNSFSKNKKYEILILYGSQTGTGKFAAEEIQRELYKNNFISKLVEMDSYEFLELPEETFIIFIISTTGYGEFPSNSKNFWNFIMRKDLPSDSLENVNYSIFGLGDSSYEKFNQCAKLLNTRLNRLSANLFHPVALGDDQHDFGYEAEFDPWTQSIIEELLNYFPEKKIENKNITKENSDDLMIDLLNNKIEYNIEIIQVANNLENLPEVLKEIYKDNNLKNKINFSYEKYSQKLNYNSDINKNKIGLITEMNIITDEKAVKKVYDVKIGIETAENYYDKIIPVYKKNIQFKEYRYDNSNIQDKFNYDVFLNFCNEKIKKFSENVKICENNNDSFIEPGDSLLLFPENDNESVDYFLKITNLMENDLILFDYKNLENLEKNKIIFPFILTAKELFKNWLNINGFPNRYFCFLASKYTDDLIYKEKLELFSSKTSVNKNLQIIFFIGRKR